ncbi:MAG: hypothetical protein MK098_01735 [Marinovum sp.]|nr:hypothetical protein [Marinovum sp.]
MIVYGPALTLAPQTTGHPLGLPQGDSSKPTTQRISDAAQGARSNASDQQQSKSTEQEQRRDRSSSSKDAPAAPPTILQLKINEMLREQAEAIADNIPHDVDKRGDPLSPKTQRSAQITPNADQPDDASDVGSVDELIRAQPKDAASEAPEAQITEALDGEILGPVDTAPAPEAQDTRA